MLENTDIFMFPAKIQYDWQWLTFVVCETFVGLAIGLLHNLCQAIK